jgi:hypothetical protein
MDFYTHKKASRIAYKQGKMISELFDFIKGYDGKALFYEKQSRLVPDLKKQNWN